MQKKAMQRPVYDVQPEDIPKVDFSSMDAPTLAKYKRAFNLHGKTSSQEELADLVQRHYDSLEVNEKDAIVYFVYAVRNQGNILKLPPQDIAGLRPSTEAPRD